MSLTATRQYHHSHSQPGPLVPLPRFRPAPPTSLCLPPPLRSRVLSSIVDECPAIAKRTVFGAVASFDSSLWNPASLVLTQVTGVEDGSIVNFSLVDSRERRAEGVFYYEDKHVTLCLIISRSHVTNHL